MGTLFIYFAICVKGAIRKKKSKNLFAFLVHLHETVVHIYLLCVVTKESNSISSDIAVK